MSDLCKNYSDNGDGGVVDFDGKLTIRPVFQRESLFTRINSVIYRCFVRSATITKAISEVSDGMGTYCALKDDYISDFDCCFCEYKYEIGCNCSDDDDEIFED